MFIQNEIKYLCFLDGIKNFQSLGEEEDEDFKGNENVWHVLSQNMSELKELLSLETKFRVKHRLFAKVSLVMQNPGIFHGPQGPESKRHPSGPTSGIRRSISQPNLEMENAEAAAASEKGALTKFSFIFIDFTNFLLNFRNPKSICQETSKRC